MRFNILSSSKYTCSDCGNTFVGPKRGATCPQCNSSLFSTVVELGMWYMLGHWLGFWGIEDATVNSMTPFNEENEFFNADPEEDFHAPDEMDSFEDGDNDFDDFELNDDNDFDDFGFNDDNDFEGGF